MSYSKSKKRKANGCMAALYHLFDFNHFYFSSHHHFTIHSPSSTSKGICMLLLHTVPKDLKPSSRDTNRGIVVVFVKFAGLKIIQESLPSTTYKDTQSFNIPPVSQKLFTNLSDGFFVELMF